MGILLALFATMGLGSLVGMRSDNSDLDDDVVPETDDTTDVEQPVLLDDELIIPRETQTATSGDDTVTLGGGYDSFEGRLGNDSIDGGAGFDTLKGGLGDDVIEGGLGKDVLYGQGNDDSLYGGSWNDSLYGGFGDDDLFGGNSNDYLYGKQGDDFLSGDAGLDRMLGGDGNDFLDGGAGADRLTGADGNDILIGGENADETNSRAATQREWLYGGDGNDLLIGGAGDDDLNGGDGNDILIGSDVVSLSPEALALQRGEISTLSQPIIKLNEEVGVDTGADDLYGGDGDDTFILGGNDYAVGGNGNDTFIVGTDWIGENDGTDVIIKNYVLEDDVIIISYDEDDGPPTLTYENKTDDLVQIFANNKLVAQVDLDSERNDPSPALSIADLAATVQLLPINPADGM